MHPPPMHQPSHVLWEPTPTSNTRVGDFGTYFFLGPRGLKTNGTQTLLFAKFIEFNLSKQNLARWPLRPQCVHVYTLACI